MSNANITINQYQELLKRITGLEQKVESKNIFVDELKEDYPHIKKTVAITDIKFNSLEEKIDYRFDIVDERFKSLHNENKAIHRELDRMWKIQLVMLAAILGMFAALIIFLFNMTKII